MIFARDGSPAAGTAATVGAVPAPLPPLPPAVRTDEQPAAVVEPTSRPVTPWDLFAALVYIACAVCMLAAAGIVLD